MGYAILRVQKLKSAVAVHRSAKHNYREQDTPNADSSRTHDNTHVGPQSVAELDAAFEARKPAKHRKDAVQCIEVLVTGSPETMAGKDREGQDAYLRDALAWLRDRFGDANVIGASIHRDETTPHLVAYVVPVDPESGRLNAKRWLGGARALSELQTGFAQGVGVRHGLERGQERSKATHKAVRQWYAEQATAEREASALRITAEDVQPQLLKAEGLAERMGLSKRVESPEMVAERLTARVRPVALAAAVAVSDQRQLRREVGELRKANKALSERFGEFVELVKGVSREQFGAVVKALVQFREQNKREARERERIERDAKRSRGPSMGR